MSISILEEWIVLFRTNSQQVSALQDRCLHRSVQLSKGRVHGEELICPYHGWRYNTKGDVTAVPSENSVAKKKCAQKYATLEQQGYIYICLAPKLDKKMKPFFIPFLDNKKYHRIQLQNSFESTVTNCAENFLDIPHTTFVHPTVFRNQRKEKMSALVKRTGGQVHVQYLGEQSDFGIFSWFLNPKKQPIRHTDEFLMPNVTFVNYWFGKKHFIILSQSVPIDLQTTKVYTDLIYDYGVWNWPARPFIRWQGQTIIDQDIEILKNQSRTVAKYGQSFQNSPSDVIHTFIQTIQHEIEQGRDPRLLSDKENRIDFWV